MSVLRIRSGLPFAGGMRDHDDGDSKAKGDGLFHCIAGLQIGFAAPRHSCCPLNRIIMLIELAKKRKCLENVEIYKRHFQMPAPVRGHIVFYGEIAVSNILKGCM